MAAADSLPEKIHSMLTASEMMEQKKEEDHNRPSFDQYFDKAKPGKTSPLPFYDEHLLTVLRAPRGMRGGTEAGTSQSDRSWR
jgi:hypothetical protein